MSAARTRACSTVRHALMAPLSWALKRSFDSRPHALRHFPSGRFNANAAWTVIACLAHNLLRWSELLGLPERRPRRARTLRRRLLTLPGRLTRTARRWTLRLPARWPWQDDYLDALARLRALSAPG